MSVCEAPSLSLHVLVAEAAGPSVLALPEADFSMAHGVLARDVPVAVLVGVDDWPWLGRFLLGLHCLQPVYSQEIM